MIYEIGHIYMIWDIDDHNLVYYGSTCDLKIRMRIHKALTNNCTSKKIIERGNYEVAILETHENIDKYDLHERERWYIENKPCVNKFIPHRTKKEYYQDNKEKIAEQKKEYYQDNKEKFTEYYQDNKEKIAEYYQDNKEKITEYYQDNKEKIAEQQKEYYQDNKEKIAEQKKEYYQNNKEQILKDRKKYRQNNKEKIVKQQKEYYQDNKEKMNEKFVCECGGKFTKTHTTTHKKSKKHLKWIQSCKI